jgi:poly(3-hydroxybutyrate) depolymerase
MFVLLLVYFFSLNYCTNIDGTEYNIIDVGGMPREFILYIPTALRETTQKVKVPLYVVFHGQTLNSDVFYDWTDFYLVAEEKSFVVVFAQGHCLYEVMCCWNSGHLKGFTDGDASQDDVKYTEALVDFIATSSIVDNVEIDTNEIIVAGFSAGGYMTYTIGTNVTTFNPFAIFPVAGHTGIISAEWLVPVVVYDPTKFGVQRESRPHVIAVYAHRDPTVPIDGGPVFGRIDTSLKDDMDFWMSQNGCTNIDKRRVEYDAEDDLELTDYGNCDKKVMSLINYNNEYSTVFETHSWIYYDTTLQNKKTTGFATQSKTLAELIYNLVQKLKGEPIPPVDPDPEPPIDDCTPTIWNTCGGCGIKFSLMLLIIIFVFFI